MEKIRYFLSLPFSDQWLLVKAYFTLIVINGLVEVIPFNKLNALITAQSKERPNSTDDSQMTQKVVNAIEVASRYTPGKTTFLIKSLTAYYLLTKSKIPVEMCIGVKLGLPGQLVSHAWIVYHGEVVLGYLENLSAYTKLTSPTM